MVYTVEAPFVNEVTKTSYESTCRDAFDRFLKKKQEVPAGLNPKNQQTVQSLFPAMALDFTGGTESDHGIFTALNYLMYILIRGMIPYKIPNTSVIDIGGSFSKTWKHFGLGTHICSLINNSRSENRKLQGITWALEQISKPEDNNKYFDRWRTQLRQLQNGVKHNTPVMCQHGSEKCKTKAVYGLMIDTLLDVTPTDVESFFIQHGLHEIIGAAFLPEEAYFVDNFQSKLYDFNFTSDGKVMQFKFTNDNSFIYEHSTENVRRWWRTTDFGHRINLNFEIIKSYGPYKVFRIKRTQQPGANKRVIYPGELANYYSVVDVTTGRDEKFFGRTYDRKLVPKYQLNRMKTFLISKPEAKDSEIASYLASLETRMILNGAKAYLNWKPSDEERDAVLAGAKLQAMIDMKKMHLMNEELNHGAVKYILENSLSGYLSFLFSKFSFSSLLSQYVSSNEYLTQHLDNFGKKEFKPTTVGTATKQTKLFLNPTCYPYSSYESPRDKLIESQIKKETNVEELFSLYKKEYLGEQEVYFTGQQITAEEEIRPYLEAYIDALKLQKNKAKDEGKTDLAKLIDEAYERLKKLDPKDETMKWANKILVNGPPGTGKSMMTKEILKDKKCSVVVPTNELQSEYGTYIKSNKINCNARTLHHALSEGGKCEVLVIDECFKFSLAELCILDYIFKPELVILVGDQGQVKYINFAKVKIEQLRLVIKDIIPTMNLVWSFTMPADAAWYLNNFHGYKIKTKSQKWDSIPRNRDENLPFQENDQVITFNQKPKKNWTEFTSPITSSESQGSRYNNVHLDFTAAKHLLEQDEGHEVVAFSRHRQNITFKFDGEEWCEAYIFNKISQIPAEYSPELFDFDYAANDDITITESVIFENDYNEQIFGAVEPISFMHELANKYGGASEDMFNATIAEIQPTGEIKLFLDHIENNKPVTIKTLCPDGQIIGLKFKVNNSIQSVCALLARHGKKFEKPAIKEKVQYYYDQYIKAYMHPDKEFKITQSDLNQAYNDYFKKHPVGQQELKEIADKLQLGSIEVVRSHLKTITKTNSLPITKPKKGQAILAWSKLANMKFCIVFRAYDFAEQRCLNKFTYMNYGCNIEQKYKHIERIDGTKRTFMGDFTGQDESHSDFSLAIEKKLLMRVLPEEFIDHYLEMRTGEFVVSEECSFTKQSKTMSSGNPRTINSNGDMTKAYYAPAINSTKCGQRGFQGDDGFVNNVENEKIFEEHIKQSEIDFGMACKAKWGTVFDFTNEIFVNDNFYYDIIKLACKVIMKEDKGEAYFEEQKLAIHDKLNKYKQADLDSLIQQVALFHDEDEIFVKDCLAYCNWFTTLSYKQYTKMTIKQELNFHKIIISGLEKEHADFRETYEPNPITIVSGKVDVLVDSFKVNSFTVKQVRDRLDGGIFRAFVFCLNIIMRFPIILWGIEYFVPVIPFMGYSGINFYITVLWAIQRFFWIWLPIVQVINYLIFLVYYWHTSIFKLIIFILFWPVVSGFGILGLNLSILYILCYYLEGELNFIKFFTNIDI